MGSISISRLSRDTQQHCISRRSKYSFLFAVILPFLAAPSLCHSQQDPGSFDVSLFRTINDGRSVFLGKLVDLNNDVVFPLGVLTPIGFLSYGILSSNVYEVDTGVLAAISEVVSFGVEQGLKRVVKRERPYLALADVHVAEIESGGSYSFPSGHATGAFALATALSLRYPKPSVYIPLHLWALFVAYGRVYLGVHYPSDVFVGGVIGSGTALAVHLLEDRILALKAKIFGGTGEEGSSLKGFALSFTPLRGGAVINLSYRL